VIIVFQVNVDGGHALELARKWELDFQIVSLLFLLFSLGEADVLWNTIVDNLAHGWPPVLNFGAFTSEGGSTEAEFRGEDLQGDFCRVTSRLPLSLQVPSNTVNAFSN